jgi:hypothetical protein
MARGGGGTIAFVRAAPINKRFPSDYALDRYLQASVVPGLPITRYGRTWRFAATEERDGLMFGRIGFDRAGVTELWNEPRQTFVRSSVPEGHTSPFVVDLSDGRVAYQVRGEAIKMDTFQWNFQALLRAGSPDIRPRVHWEVRKILNIETMAAFLGRASRVDEMAFTLQMPNPDFHGREQIEHIVGDTNAARARVVLDAPVDQLDGLDVSAPFILEAREHIERYGKARVKAEFVDDDGIAYEDKWRSEAEGTPRTESAPVNPSTGEVSLDSLARSLESGQVGQSSREDDEDDEE